MQEINPEVEGLRKIQCLRAESRALHVFSAHETLSAHGGKREIIRVG